MAHIAPLSYVWLVTTNTKSTKPSRVPARVETRTGGAYRVEILGTTETRIVNRNQLIRVTPKSAGAFRSACGEFVPFQSNGDFGNGR